MSAAGTGGRPPARDPAGKRPAPLRRPARVRLDVLLAERGLAESRERARALVLAGRVRIDGRPAEKPGAAVPADARVEVLGGLPYVSRGGLKLEAALKAFGVSPAGRAALDVGASTGGFTDCLLRAGAARVYAVDVGYGQLDLRLRRDPRVVALERTNIRHLAREALGRLSPSPAAPGAPDLAAIDVSFISLRLVLPAVARLLDPPREVIALVKPQFEVGKGQVGKGGVVRDPAKHRAVLLGLGEAARAAGFALRGAIPSPLLGPQGNREFFVHLVGGRGDERGASEAKGEGQARERERARGRGWPEMVDACLAAAARAEGKGGGA